MSNGKSPKRLQIIFDEGTLAAIERLKNASGSAATAADVIRDALGFYEYTRQQVVEEGRDVAFLKSGTDPSVVKLAFSIRQALSLRTKQPTRDDLDHKDLQVAQHG